jgi:hypothetical protein
VDLGPKFVKAFWALEEFDEFHHLLLGLVATSDIGKAGLDVYKEGGSGGGDIVVVVVAVMTAVTQWR